MTSAGGGRAAGAAGERGRAAPAWRRLAGLDPFAVAAMVLGGLLVVPLALHYRAAAAATPTFVGQGFPLDDAWIHAQFALNATRGHLLQYEVGVPSSGSTSPLWSLLEGLALALTGDPVTAGHGLGVLSTVLMIAAAVLLGRRLGLRGVYLLAVPVLCAASWRLAWAAVSGMEVTLVAFVLLVALRVYLDERDRDGLALWSGLLAGLLFWARPEGLAAIGVMALDQAYLYAVQRELAAGRRLRRTLSLAGGFALLALPLMAWNAAVGPGPFPQTLYAKGQVQSLGRGVHMFFQLFVDLWGSSPVWHAFYAAAGYAATRRLLAWRERFPEAVPVLFLLAWFGGIALLRGSGDYYSRYLMPCIALLVVLGLDALRAALEALRFHGRSVVAAGLIGLLAFEGWPEVRATAATYGLNVASVSGHVVAMGRWAARHLPPEAVISMSDVGAISYFTENRVVDMRGLVSPYHGWDRLAELDRQRREAVDYAMLFPELNERVILRGGYLPVHAITLEANNISATDNLVVYRTPWSDRRRLRQVGLAFDFEEPDSVRGWSAAGVLARPPVSGALEGQRQVVNLGGGAGLLSSFGPGGDEEVGWILTPPFEIEGEVITIRVGGGDDAERLGARLWVDGRVERTAVGARSEVLVQREWDVRELRGRRARIEVRDESAGPWGHVLVDEIRQYRVEGGPAPALVGLPAEGPAEPERSRRAAEASPPERRGAGVVGPS